METVSVIVNGRALAHQMTGVGRYAAEILHCLGDRVRIVRPANNAQGVRGHAWEQFTLPGKITSRSILWSPANTGPLSNLNQVLTVHDLSPLEHPEWFKPAFAIWYRVFLPILIRRVKCVITPSEHVRRKVVSRFHIPEDRVVAIHAGVNLDRFYRQEAPTRFGRYILFVGSIEPRKNLPTLLTAWKLVEKRHPDVSLVLAGVPGPVFREVHFPGQVERLNLAGYIPDSGLPALYSGADIFILPSFDEGFGLPVLEAMACGTPVAASTQGALPEVIGDAGLLFHPDNPAALSEIISQCLSNPQQRKSLSERGFERVRQFSWQSATELVWQTLRGGYES